MWSQKICSNYLLNFVDRNKYNKGVWNIIMPGWQEWLSFNLYSPSQPYAGLLFVHFATCCGETKPSISFLLCTCLLRWYVILKTCHLNSNHVPQERMSQVKSLCRSFDLKMQSRWGSCSELSCLTSEDILSVTSFITSQMINSAVWCIRLFSSAELPGDIHGSGVRDSAVGCGTALQAGRTHVRFQMGSLGFFID